MKVSEKTWMTLGGGYRTLLLVVAVLGLVSLIGCSNASGGGTTNGSSGAETGGSKVDPNNPFVGTWEIKTSDTTTSTLIFRSNGTMGGSLIPITGYTYTVADSVATISYTAQGHNRVVATATLKGENTLEYSAPPSQLTLTKKQ